MYYTSVYARCSLILAIEERSTDAAYFIEHTSYLQNSGWMNGNPTSSPFSGWNEGHGGSMRRNASLEMGRSGEVDRRP